MFPWNWHIRLESYSISLFDEYSFIWHEYTLISLGETHAHTYIQTDFVDKNNFKKPAMLDQKLFEMWKFSS